MVNQLVSLHLHAKADYCWPSFLEGKQLHLSEGGGAFNKISKHEIQVFRRGWQKRLHEKSEKIANEKNSMSIKEIKHTAGKICKQIQIKVIG